MRKPTHISGVCMRKPTHIPSGVCMRKPTQISACICTCVCVCGVDWQCDSVHVIADNQMNALL
jgi:hypothetical protein